MEYIESAAKELGVDLGRGGAKPLTEEEQEDRAENDSDRRAKAMPLGRLGTILKHRAADKSVAPPRSSEERPNMSGDEEQRPKTSPPPREGRSPLFLAVNVLEAMPESVPVPMIGPLDLREEDFLSPVASSKLSTSGAVPRSGLDGSVAGIPQRESSEAEYQSGPIVGSMESLPQATKIPAPYDAASTSRTYAPTPIKIIEAPWSRPSSRGRRDPFRAMKANEDTAVSRHEPPQPPGTFVQPSERDLARDASMKERSERRMRFARRTSVLT